MTIWEQWSPGILRDWNESVLCSPPMSLDSRARSPVLLRLYLQLLASSNASTTVAEHDGGDGGNGRVPRLGRVFWHLVASLVHSPVVVFS